MSRNEDKYYDSQRSVFDSNINPSKNRIFPTSSFLKRKAFTKDSESSTKYQTPQSYPNAYPFGKTSSPSRKDKMKSFRQEIVEQVKVRVEELQSKMKSKSDMFYVMRHMGKKYLWINLLRWLSSLRVRWLSNTVHEGYLDRNKKGMLSIFDLDRVRS